MADANQAVRITPSLKTAKSRGKVRREGIVDITSHLDVVRVIHVCRHSTDLEFVAFYVILKLIVRPFDSCKLVMCSPDPNEIVKSLKESGRSKR